MIYVYGLGHARQHQSDHMQMGLACISFLMAITSCLHVACITYTDPKDEEPPSIRPPPIS